MPADHEIIDRPYGAGEPADPKLAAEAIRAAFTASKLKPIKGKPFAGRRTRLNLPQEGEADYERAMMMQAAAAEVLAAAEGLLEEKLEVDARIAEVYARSAADDVDS